jgi:hypothetical protein
MTINYDKFSAIPDDSLLQLLRENFAEDLDRLTRASSIRDFGVNAPPTPSPSRRVYRAEYDEVNRTLVSVLSLRWICNNQYDTFVGTQPEPVRLTRQSFDWLRTLVAKALSGPQDVHTLVTSVIINDLGKDPSLASDYRNATGQDISAQNHDTILLKAAEAGLVHSLHHLSLEQQEQIMVGLQIGAEFNFGQLAQAENAPVSLSSLRPQTTEKDRHAFDLHFAEQLLDIAGAAGHMDWTCAQKLIEPILDAYRNVYYVVTQVVSARLTPRDGYDLILVRRGDMLSKRGFRSLNVRDPSERALLRVLCMGGVADVATANLYDTVWNSISHKDESASHGRLVHALNVDGSNAEPAMQPTYMPALLTQAVKGDGRPRSRGDRERALRSALRYMTRVMCDGVEQGARGLVTLFERDVLDAVKVVQSQEFRDNPAILDRVRVPKAVVIMPQ